MRKQVAELVLVSSSQQFATDDSGESITYGDAFNLGKKLCDNIQDERSLVFLLCSNTNLTLSAYLYLLTSDHVILLLDEKIEEGLLEKLIELYHPDCILRPDDKNMPVRQIQHQEKISLHKNLSILLSTSGSTGSPKLARFTKDSIFANANSIAQYLDIGQLERPFCHLPVHYSFGFSIINSHIIKGAHIQLTNRSIMERGFWDRFREAKATSFSGVPFHFEILKRLRFERQDLPTLRTLTQAGGKLSPDLVVDFATLAHKKNYKFIVMYGQTEAGPRISYLPFEMAQSNPNSIGKAIPSVTLSLAADDGSYIEKEGVIGELVCSSPALMMGYAQCAKDLSLGDEVGGKLLTGDLARKNKDGLYEITGRNNRFIKLQGNRVNLDEVEEFVKGFGVVAACVGVDNELYIAIEDKNVIDEIKSKIINSFKFPPRCLTIEHIKKLPRNENGKMQYAILLAMVSEKEVS